MHDLLIAIGFTITCGAIGMIEGLILMWLVPIIAGWWDDFLDLFE